MEKLWNSARNLTLTHKILNLDMIKPKCFLILGVQIAGLFTENYKENMLRKRNRLKEIDKKILIISSYLQLFIEFCQIVEEYIRCVPCGCLGFSFLEEKQWRNLCSNVFLGQLQSRCCEIVSYFIYLFYNQRQ